MPRRNDINKILIIGSGPIVIGQGCEFDYAGTQAVKALKKEGFHVVLVNSNPATIMTDPDLADTVYIEPLTPESLHQIIEKERPDALLPTVGGQVALNLAYSLSSSGILESLGVELLGAPAKAIAVAEDRHLFRHLMTTLGYDTPTGIYVRTLSEAKEAVRHIGFPVIIRPSFTLGGFGSSIAKNAKEFDGLVEHGLEASPISEILIEESIFGWKEYEMEVMSDAKGTGTIICSIENIDPMGVHTGDSITVAPAQTLTDREYQTLRTMAIQILKNVGVKTGGANVQFGVHPQNGRVVVIEMNPRVSRSSSLASKATGFPIAKIAALLAVGYTLDELHNDITKKTVCAFEPSIDYVVVKIPRFSYEKFPGTNDILGTQMRAVGETMAIGRTFKEAIQKGYRSLEIGLAGLESPLKFKHQTLDMLRDYITVPHYDRLLAVYELLLRDDHVLSLAELTKYDPWFLYQMHEISTHAKLLHSYTLQTLDKSLLMKSCQLGFSSRQISALIQSNEAEIENLMQFYEIHRSYLQVDTCAAEFESETPYYYSTFENFDEGRVSNTQKIIIIGSGPNRIGQGIEFDYCCVHAIQEFRNLGFETVMVNNNPSTVSTDYDTSDKLYFEPLQPQEIFDIWQREKPSKVVLQFGGQTPISLAKDLQKRGVHFLGTSPESIDIAEDRERFSELLRQLNIPCPDFQIVNSEEELRKIAPHLPYPVLVRPSYVIGGLAMQLLVSHKQLEQYFETHLDFFISHRNSNGNLSLLVDQYLDHAIEIDVDAISDGSDVIIGGIMEHIEPAGAHSGDSFCVLPAQSLSEEIIQQLISYTRELALALNTIGLINIQYAIHNGRIYVLEANPRASRTVPFVSKATGSPLVKIACKVMAGEKLSQMGLLPMLETKMINVKAPVFCYDRFVGTNIFLGPQMRSIGEVMGRDHTFAAAFAKAHIASGVHLPEAGLIHLSGEPSEELSDLAGQYSSYGFLIMANEKLKKSLPPTVKTFLLTQDHEDNIEMLTSYLRLRAIAALIHLDAGTLHEPCYHIKLREIASLCKIPIYTQTKTAQTVLKAIQLYDQHPFEYYALS